MALQPKQEGDERGAAEHKPELTEAAVRWEAVMNVYRGIVAGLLMSFMLWLVAGLVLVVVWRVA